jgi:hypothetical protein
MNQHVARRLGHARAASAPSDSSGPWAALRDGAARSPRSCLRFSHPRARRPNITRKPSKDFLSDSRSFRGHSGVSSQARSPTASATLRRRFSFCAPARFSPRAWGRRAVVCHESGGRIRSRGVVCADRRSADGRLTLKIPIHASDLSQTSAFSPVTSESTGIRS